MGRLTNAYFSITFRVGMLFNVMLTISGRFANDDVWSRSIEFWDIDIVLSFNNDVRSRLGTSWNRLLSE